MNRRGFLKFLLSTPLAATIDFEQLLWTPKPIITVPGPVKLASLSEIVAIELERMQPLVKNIFERDDTFYQMISRGKVINAPMGEMRVPLILKPGGFRDNEDF
jgi:hypothetical protein